MIKCKPAKRPRGKPFTKNDPRINKAGNLNAALQVYEIRLRQSLADKLIPEAFADIIVDEVKRHRPGAREFFRDMTVGKPAERHEHSGAVDLSFIFGNGNGEPH